MKVLIDTNVLVSAALRDKDPEAVILNTTILSVALFKKLIVDAA